MQKYQRLLNLEATHSEILMDFRRMDCGIEEMPSPEKVKVKEKEKEIEKKTIGRKGKNKKAICGVLGLASLIGDRDGKNHQFPEDWFQPYPLIEYNPNEYLPTGIPLQGKRLVNASFEVYYKGRVHENSLS